MLEFAIRRHRNGEAAFTGYAIRDHFSGDPGDGYRNRAPELHDAGFLVVAGCEQNPRTGYRNKLWSVHPRVLWGDREPWPYCIVTEKSNRLLIAAWRNLLLRSHDAAASVRDRMHRTAFKLEEVMAARMHTGTLRDKDNEPIRPCMINGRPLNCMTSDEEVPEQILRKLLGED